MASPTGFAGGGASRSSSCTAQRIAASAARSSATAARRTATLPSGMKYRDPTPQR
jgi:hypothetical protein